MRCSYLYSKYDIDLAVLAYLCHEGKHFLSRKSLLQPAWICCVCRPVRDHQTRLQSHIHRGKVWYIRSTILELNALENKLVRVELVGVEVTVRIRIQGQRVLVHQ
jgi:hypothetical protein